MKERERESCNGGESNVCPAMWSKHVLANEEDGAALEQVGVSNRWVWGRHNWVGYIKLIYPLKPI